MNIKIIYEDEDILVIDKPSGITVNRADTEKEETIQDWAEHYLKITNPKLQTPSKLQDSNNKKKLEFGALDLEFAIRAGVVHRLDKETSGLLLIAKNPKSFLALQKQFKQRKVEKVYLALVHGEVRPDRGEINVPVGRLPYNRTRFGIVVGGRDSVTSYRVISNFQFPMKDSHFLNSIPRLGGHIR